MVQSTHGDGTDGYPDDEGYDGYEKRAYQGYGRKMGRRDAENQLNGYSNDYEDYVGNENEKRAYLGYARKIFGRRLYKGYDGYGGYGRTYWGHKINQ